MLIITGQPATRQQNTYGGGTNVLCLDTNTSDTYTKDYNPFYPAYLGGVEYYQTANSGYDATCAVCMSSKKSTLMIPNRSSCPPGWVKEYGGALAASPSHSSSYFAHEYICVDQAFNRTASNSNGYEAFLTYAYFGCGNLPCTIMSTSTVPACSVCSR